jgi:phosphate transport system substrate-binding protein
MHDEFLHRLRKDPRPEFAARLHARLRRQSATPLRCRASSRIRTLVTALLLGGVAFAVTFVMITGVPTSVRKTYREVAARIFAGRVSRTYPTPALNPGDVAGEGASRPASPAGAALRRETAASARAITGVTQARRSRGTAASNRSLHGVPAGQRGNQIRMVSSRAAYPYAAAIARRVNRMRGAGGARFPHISISVSNSGRWLGALCGGGGSAPELAYRFAPVATVSDQPCPRAPNGQPSQVRAIPFGYEAVALARSPLYGEIDLTRREIFLALAKWVPDPGRSGVIHRNSSTTWQQIDAALGPEPIQFLGPPLSSPAGRSVIGLLLEPGCRSYRWIAALKTSHPHRYARICRTMRTDGAYVATPALNPTALLGKPDVLGIFGLATLLHSPTTVSVSRLDGVRPTLQSIESGTYPASRELYLYFNRDRVPPTIAFRLLGQQQLAGFPGVRADWALITPPQVRTTLISTLDR